ncbi:MAG: nucleotidyltransferase family protein [Lachnospiraceae bacterium]|jgi:predicted nucleotidyltransferase
MKVTGIIAEYNPFHNGHAYHLRQTRELLESDYIVVIMSGNYVQRGAPTIIDKYSRCEMALKCGADLVLELPSCFSTASAEYFAFGGIAILDKLGVVDNLCFGTESLDGSILKNGRIPESASSDILDYFEKIAELLINETPEFKQVVVEGMRSGLSHAAAISEGVEKILGEDYRLVLETANNILGVEYLKSIKRLESNIKPAPIARMLSDHRNTAVMEGFSSATSIRNAIFNRYDINFLAGTVPEAVHEILMDKYLVTFPIFRDDFSIILGEKLLSCSCSEDLTEYFGVTPDLANRMFNLRNDFRSFNQFRELINCKSISKATVGRALMHITLDIRAKDKERLSDADSLKAVKVLGFREAATPLLSRIKKHSAISLVTKLADYVPDSEPDMIVQTTKADMLYRLICMNKFDTEIKNPYEREIVII